MTATAGSGSEVDLSWGASTDNVGVTGYDVERCAGASCTTFAQIAATSGTGTTYKDTTVSASTGYSYRVRAIDAAGNHGAYSNTASATTPTPGHDSALRARDAHRDRGLERRGRSVLGRVDRQRRRDRL